MAVSLTITQLAEEVGMTARNIRAHQSRGLVHSPRIQGRVARYGGDHVARLELISSLQREGFTLAAIKRLIDTPDSYASIVADRRRRFRNDTSDIVRTVPVPVERLQDLLPQLPELPDDLTKTGLVWMQDGVLVTHTMLMGIGRTLAAQGVPPGLLARLMLDAASSAQRLGEAFRAEVEQQHRDDRRLDDLTKVAVQLSAAAFEIAFLAAAGQRTTAAEARPNGSASRPRR
jgi:DNA-binding transcriptional MerR regulator